MSGRGNLPRNISAERESNTMRPISLAVSALAFTAIPSTEMREGSQGFEMKER
jgi:hypothetical protein